MNCSKMKTIPKRISLSDNRCFVGACVNCGEFTYYCETIHKYMCCQCCEKPVKPRPTTKELPIDREKG